jgi:hypothetical protein
MNRAIFIVLRHAAMATFIAALVETNKHTFKTLLCREFKEDTFQKLWCIRA